MFVIVGTAKDLHLKPRRNSGGFVHVYRIENAQLVLVHKTQVDDVPTALCPFQGTLRPLFLSLPVIEHFSINMIIASKHIP